MQTIKDPIESLKKIIKNLTEDIDCEKKEFNKYLWNKEELNYSEKYEKWFERSHKADVEFLKEELIYTQQKLKELEATH